jgi:hypothetical protein
MYGDDMIYGYNKETGISPNIIYANHFGNRSGPFGSHQFGKNNPNSKRNLALMKTYQKNMQAP